MENQTSLTDTLIIIATMIPILIAIGVIVSRSKGQVIEQTLEGEQKKILRVVKVHYVIDGDTVIVSEPWRKKTVRLDAIDCPERGQGWGNTAKYGLIKLIGGRRVLLEDHGQDSYGRTLATIYVKQEYGSQWMNVNARMVTLGHAWVMRKYYNHLPNERQDELNRLERWARAKKVGLWKTANPVPPWRWRRSSS